jgi:hypothetical protein
MTLALVALVAVGALFVASADAPPAMRATDAPPVGIAEAFLTADGPPEAQPIGAQMSADAAVRANLSASSKVAK